MKQNSNSRKTGTVLVAVGLALQYGSPACAQTPPGTASTASFGKSYSLGRKVNDFPANEDFSTPEAAYASIHRAYVAEGDVAFERLTVGRKPKPVGAAPRPLTPRQAEPLLNAEVAEVHFYGETNASVLARIRYPNRNEVIDIRNLEFSQGRWLNVGNDQANSLEAARKLFAFRCGQREAERALSSRPAIAHPEEYLRPFVAFLKREAADPQEFLLSTLATRRVVILSEVHHRPRYWGFNAGLVKQPGFARHAGVIYLELPCNDQGLVDQFLAASHYDPQPVIEMLRDMLWMGWPDQAMLDFFKAVWEANQALPKGQRVRIVLVDMARPWKEITKRSDWRKYDVDRDQFMADNIARDLRERGGDRRHALFIVGYLHAMVNLSGAGGDPIRSAGWHLRETMGETNVFAVFPHSPVMSNNGEAYGRLALGLFETAFAALTNRPMAFPLDQGPFGEQIFDASPEYPTTAPFSRGYHAYLYLGPLEDEAFSPLIPGFYTEEFTQELDRRHRLMEGAGLVAGCRLARLDAESFVRWMGNSWGRPRRAWAAAQLGPLDAWQLGSQWEKKMAAAKLQGWTQDKEAVRQAASRLFDAIRRADYDHPGDWHDFPAPNADYRVHADAPGWMNWICRHFRTNPIVEVTLGEPSPQAGGGPAVTYKVVLKDGARLEGLLPLEWDVRAQTWIGVEGLDWHLHSGAPKQD